jgi:hypothetical protein
MRFGLGHQRVARAPLALLVALCVLVSAVLGGHRYFYCPQMGEVGLDACCPSPSHAAHSDTPAIDRTPCCASERFSTPAPGTLASQKLTLRAPYVALLPMPAPIAAPTRPELAWRSAVARVGPGDPSPRENRLRLMVFLT